MKRQIKGHALLAGFLKKNGINFAAAGRSLWVSRVTVHHWAEGVKVPCKTNRTAIEIWTGGIVPASSWPADEIKEVAPFQRATTRRTKAA